MKIIFQRKEIVEVRPRKESLEIDYLVCLVCFQTYLPTPLRPITFECCNTIVYPVRILEKKDREFVSYEGHLPENP